MEETDQSAFAGIRIGLLIPAFPSQTHIAMWRVGQAMRTLGAHVQLMSTKRPGSTEMCHQSLAGEMAGTVYAWPPRVMAAMAWMIAKPIPTLRALRYVMGLGESTLKERVKILGLGALAAGLAAEAQKRHLQHIFVHSCADAAHLAALVERLGGPSYSLRLGGDLDVYGKDHKAKMERASFIVAAAANNKEEIHRRVGLADGQVFWSWLGVDVDRFRPSEREHRLDEPLHVVTVARLNRAKGHVHVLAAMRTAINRGVAMRYTMAGSGPFEGELRARANELGLGTYVDFRSALDERQVVELLQSADVFVLPSTGIGEASPVAVIEAMSCGLAVICSRIGGTANMIDDGMDGILVNPGDETEIAAALVDLGRDEARRQTLGRKARERAERQFDCKAVAARILDRIVRIANESFVGRI